jgi:hypothetical protein
MNLADGQTVDKRLIFQEQMRLAPLPDRFVDEKLIKRYMSERAPWMPGADLPFGKDQFGPGKTAPIRPRAYGGHVYSQSGLAASRTFAETYATSTNGNSKKQFGIHVSFFAHSSNNTIRKRGGS